LKILLSFFIFFIGALTIYAQDIELKYSDNPDVFIGQFIEDMKKSGVPLAETEALNFAALWKKSVFPSDDQTRIIQTLNNMYFTGQYKTYPDLLAFVKTYGVLIQKENQIKIDARSFFDVTDSCINNQESKQVMVYLNYLSNILVDGTCFKTTNSSWRVTSLEGDLIYNELNDLGGQAHPKLVFQKTNLIYKSERDSSIIKETVGEFHLQARQFYGIGGKINWAKVGLDPGVVYAEIPHYALDLNFSKIEIDSVEFHYHSLFKKTIKGKFTDINQGVYDPSVAQYPLFEGYEGGIVIDRYIPSVMYEGGFTLRGIQKIGKGYYKTITIVPEEPEKGLETEAEEVDTYFTNSEVITFPETYEEYTKASISILDQHNRIRVRIYADEFNLNPEKITSKLAESVIYVGTNDSLTHPGLNVIYEAGKSILRLYKDPTEILSRQPFYNSYTKYNIYTESMQWNVKEDSTITFTATIDKENKLAAFESQDYFNKKRFDQFSGILGFHPAGVIYAYTYKYPGMPVFADKVLESIKRNNKRDGFILALNDLQGSGFITWDPLSGEIFPRPKLFHWVRAARGKKDYDQLLFLSTVEDGGYATLNLNDLMIDVRGVVILNFSDSQYVKAVTQDREITLLGNRDILFNGAVAAGKINLIGSRNKNMFHFDYDKFRIECDSIDSLRFILKRQLKMDEKFSPLQNALRNTTFEGVSGAILIDRPDNKSSRKKSPNYSAFDSYSNSYVYWEKPDIFNSVYERKKLYFAVYPFLLDSLENFDEYSLRFEGELFTSEIFPLFEQYLQPMPDNTMGIVQMTPAEGYDIYEGKGKYYKEINMDGMGLHGSGDLSYLATRAVSDTFRFFFDTVTARVNTFIQMEGMYAGAYFPGITAKNIDYRWFTKNDILEIQTIDRPMKIFGGKGIYEGKLTITPEGMKGSGILKLDLVTIASDEILFTEGSVDVQRGMFTVADAEAPDRLQMEALDVSLKYNLAADRCEFETGTEGKPQIIFHEQKYVTSLGKGVYDKSSNDVKLFAKSKEVTRNYFLSTDVVIDSLTFYAKESYFNFKERMLRVSGVPFIKVADAKVVPDSTDEILINREGNIQPIKNAKIIAHRDSNFHTIYDATVNISSLYNYTANGRYDYIKVEGAQMFINFDEIKVGIDTITHATGTIREAQKFFITDRILFDGKVELYGNKKFMKFSGNVKIQSKNPVFSNKSFEFSDWVDPENIFIPVTQDKMGKLVLGVYFNPIYRNFNSRFLQEKQDIKDKEVFSAKGNKVGLTYDRERQEFRIGVREKFNEEVYKGNQVSLNDNNNLITSEGIYNFPYQFTQGLLDLKVSGRWAEQGKNNITSNMLWAFDMKPMPKKSFENLADGFSTLFNLSQDIEYEERFLMECIAEILDENSSDEKITKAFVSDLEKTGIISNVDLAKRMPYSVVLSGLKFTYNDKLKTLAYSGEAGLIGLGGKKVNKLLNTFIEYEFGKGVAQGRENDKIRLYIEIDDMNWVYFNISGEVIRTTSTEMSYQDVIRSDAEKAKGKGNRCELADDSEVTEFIQQFRNRHMK